MDTTLTRRSLLTAGTGAATALYLGGLGRTAAALARDPRLSGYPFALGVASGEPAADGAVLWTRLALDPLGESEMPTRPVPVRYEIARDEGMRSLVRRGETIARPRDGFSVHVEPRGLLPGREYWYRFIADGEASPVGRTKTAPRPGSDEELSFCLVSCSQFEHGYFTAYRHIVEDDPNFLVHVGYYIYEYGTDEYEASGGNVRHHVGPEITSLADYRRRYGQYHTDADLLEARRLIPFITTPDDHEVENNYAGAIPEDGQDPVAFRARRAAAYQAYWEFMPLRRAQRARDGSIRLFRSLPFGRTANLVVGDTRQFRSDQPCEDEYGTDCEAMDDPAQTMLGSPQERLVVETMARSRARWNVLAQTVFMAQLDSQPGAGEAYNPDAWDGYKASRNRVLGGIAARGVSNPVVLTGDVHQHWAADLRADYSRDDTPVIGSELVATSVTSGGDGTGASQDSVLAENPWVKYNLNRRGYVRSTLDSSEWRADFRTMPFVKQPGAPAETAASFVMRDGSPGLQPA